MLAENEFKKLETFDSTYFRGNGHSEDAGTQTHFAFQTTYRYFERVSKTNDHILSWKSD